MMRHLLHMFLFAVVLSGAALAQKPNVILGPGEGLANFRKPYVQTGTRTLSKDTVYVLTGWYFVDSTAVLSIPAGTLIVGDSASGGALIVRRGGFINAAGTVTNPVVLTSRKAPGTRRPGDWGGVIILGKAPTNKPSTQQIEGGFDVFAPGLAAYGGNNPDDSSGVLTFVRIEFAGIAFAQDNEINGLTFGAVGRKTVVHHIQVSFANDDDYEFFGGTVQAKYLVSWRSLDDVFDSDFGFDGKIQFGFVKRDPDIFDASASGSSNGFESDNEATAPFTARPRTQAKYVNISLVGPAADSTAANALNAKWDYMSMIRRSSRLSIYNSILTGYRKGINLRDTLTQVAAMQDTLQIRNTSLAVPREVVRTSSSPATGVPPGFDVVAWFNTAGFGNLGSTPRQGTDLLPAAAWNLNNSVNPVPSPASEAATAGTMYGGRLRGDAFFDSVSYRGAFDPALPFNQQWTAGWTNFDPQATVYTSIDEVSGTIPESFTLDQNYPNPFNPSTTIKFALPGAGFVSLKIYNLLGQEVATLVDQVLASGSYQTTFDGSRLASGIYVSRLQAGGTTLTRKMVLLK